MPWTWDYDNEELFDSKEAILTEQKERAQSWEDLGFPEIAEEIKTTNIYEVE